MSEKRKTSLGSLLFQVTTRTGSHKERGAPYIGLENITSGGSKIGSYGRAEDSISSNSIFESGDILFGKLRPRLRKSVRAQFRGYCSTDVLVLRVAEDVHPGFAGYVAQSDTVFSAAIRTEEGTKMPRCSWKDIKLVEVFCPVDNKEQAKIASVLASLDLVIEKTEALIEKYQQIKAGLMHDLFTRGVLPDGKLRPTREQAPDLYRETGVGWVPKEWQIVALEGCLQHSPKNGYSPREIENWEGVYVLGLGCLTKEGFEPKQLKNAPRTAAIASGSMLNDGDFLISRANTPELVGLCGVYADVGVAAIYPDLMMRLSLVSLLDARFLEAQMLYSETRIRLTALAVGTSSSMVKLNSASLKKFQLFFPALEEQKTIVEKLGIQQSLIDSEKKKLAKLRVVKNGLMHDLLTGKVAVKVDEAQEEHV